MIIRFILYVRVRGLRLGFGIRVRLLKSELVLG